MARGVSRGRFGASTVALDRLLLGATLVATLGCQADLLAPEVAPSVKVAPTFDAPPFNPFGSGRDAAGDGSAAARRDGAASASFDALTDATGDAPAPDAAVDAPADLPYASAGGSGGRGGTGGKGG